MSNDSNVPFHENEFFISKYVMDGADYVKTKKQELDEAKKIKDDKAKMKKEQKKARKEEEKVKWGGRRKLKKK